MNRSLVAFVSACAALLAAPLTAAPVINEIMYRPGTGYPENTGLEFIELHNPGTAAVDLSGWALTDGVDYTFPSGTTLAAGGYLVIAGDVTALKAATGLSTVYGPWESGDKLSNNGETITLSQLNSDGEWEEVDSVDYADEGDWATRTRDSLGGWSWVTTATTSNRSMERRNPNLSKNTGQNWGVSSSAGGSPGVVNSVYSTNVAPLITGVKHSPAVPKSTDTVTISANLTDESAASALTATLYWRDATSTSPGSFTAAAMSGDGTGAFSATLAARSDKAIVEFYVSATDGTNTRTWPAATSEGQNANCAYQVDNEVYSGTAPIYRLVLTGAENAAYTSLASSNPQSDRLFNFTLVASTGDDTTIRYLAAMRFRGNSSRSYSIKPLRISLPTDDRWDGISDFLINPRGAPVQFLAHRALRAAGLVAADASPLEVRRNGVEYTVSSGSAGDYGQLVRIEEINGDYVDNHFPEAVSGQVYRKVSITSWAYSSSTAPTTPSTNWSGWSKESHSAANDWSDVMNFSKVWNQVAYSHFSGATSTSVASGTWNGVAFTDAEVATLATVCDLDYLARYLAIMTILPNAEENLSTGEDDDYAGAFINDGTNTRFLPIPHDLDTTFGLGESTTTATTKGLYDATETYATTSGFADTLMRPLQPLLGDSTRAGNAAFRTKYLTAIRELFGTVFDADTSSNSYPPFYQFVDAHLGSWATTSYRTSIKTFMTARQTYLLGLIGAAKITATSATSTGTLAATTTPTLRINEVLASNTTLANGTLYPDLIELHNTGTSAVSLAGYTLTDDGASDSATYTFPSGTTLAAGAYLTVYASTSTLSTGLNAGFQLDAEGDSVILTDASGTLVDSITFGYQIPNYSISRTGTSGDTWALTTPTIGSANASAATLGGVNSVKINEWAGRVSFRVDHDFIELHNAASAPVALAGVCLTDDTINYPKQFAFASLSYIAPGGFLTLFGGDLPFGLDADFDVVSLLGENGATIDQVDFIAQPADHSTGRTTDGGTSVADFSVPTPGISNATSLPSAYSALLNSLRISEVMYQPVATSSAGNYEYIELQNIGSAALDLSGVRFTNGLDYTFPSGTTLAAGAYLVVCKNQSAFVSRYPAASALTATGVFTGALDNSGENIALSLPSPWYVHILKFRYESSWYDTTAGGGYSLVARTPATTAARNWGESSTWRASAGLNGSPGFADGGTFSVSVNQAAAIYTTEGGTTYLSVSVATSGSATYQWQKLVDGQWTDISGATAASYTITSTTTSAAGSYRVLVTVSGVTVSSSTVTVSVTSTSSTARLASLSIRALTLTGDNIVIPGFVVPGSVTKRLVVRAVGPTLTNYGVSGALADPTLTLKRYTSAGYVDLASNDNWGDNTNADSLATVTANVGGFPLASGAADASLLVDLDPGTYTATAAGVASTTGVALVELYDADGTAAPSQLSSISARAYVGTGANVLIAGFVIGGDGTKTLLVRGVGPGLTTYGVSGVLADPKLTLYSGSDVIATNDDWSGDASVTSASSLVGAFTLTDGSKDAATVVTLPAGAYTVHISGVSDTTGVALVELYVVP